MNTSSGRSATAFNVPDEKVEDGLGGLLWSSDALGLQRFESFGVLGFWGPWGLALCGFGSGFGAKRVLWLLLCGVSVSVHPQSGPRPAKAEAQRGFMDPKPLKGTQTHRTTHFRL